MTDQKTSILMTQHFLLQGKLTSLIAKELSDLDVPITGTLSRNIINFVKMRLNYQDQRNLKTKRHQERDLESRISTITSVWNQKERDSNYFKNPYAVKYLKRNLIIALLEQSIVQNDSLNSSDTRSVIGLSFHLWLFKKNLEKRNITKPVETLSVMMENVFDEKISVGTINNRLTLVQKLIDESKEHGACHDIQSIGEWPVANSKEFLKDLSRGCDRCLNAWTKVLPPINPKELVTLEAAGEILKQKLDDQLKELIDEAISEIHNMPAEKFLEDVPQSILNVLPYFD